MDCNTRKCGCEDAGLQAPCPPTINCTNPQPCSEVFSEQCIINDVNEMIYGDLVLSKYENLYTSLQKLMILANSGDPSLSPVNFRATTITSTEITLQWELQNTGTIISLEWGITSSLGTSISLTTGDVGVIKASLTADTDYYFKVTSDTEDSVIIKVKTLTA
jgi:hypothetical protein